MNSYSILGAYITFLFSSTSYPFLHELNKMFTVLAHRAPKRTMVTLSGQDAPLCKQKILALQRALDQARIQDALIACKLRAYETSSGNDMHALVADRNARHVHTLQQELLCNIMKLNKENI